MCCSCVSCSFLCTHIIYCNDPLERIISHVNWTKGHICKTWFPSMFFLVEISTPFNKAQVSIPLNDPKQIFTTFECIDTKLEGFHLFFLQSRPGRTPKSWTSHWEQEKEYLKNNFIYFKKRSSLKRWVEISHNGSHSAVALPFFLISFSFFLFSYTQNQQKNLLFRASSSSQWGRISLSC